MPNSKLKEKIKEVVSKLKHRKKTEGQVNIEGVTRPKKHKPKEVKQQNKKPHSPGSVSIGAHGGRYVQEPSGHKRYVKEGQVSGTKKYKKSIQETLEDIVRKGQAEEFVKSFKGKK